MVCLAEFSYIPSSPKQKLIRRQQVIFALYENYFRDREIRDYYRELYNIDLTRVKPAPSCDITLSGVS